MCVYSPQVGDIAACYGRDFASRFISGVTVNPFSPSGLRFGPSHVAIIADLHFHQGRYWYESTTMCGHDCLMAGKPDSGVQVHHHGSRIKDYTSKGGKVAIYRLTRSLSNADESELSQVLFDYLSAGTEYDMDGAITSGARITRRLLNLFGVHDDRLFCSELVAAGLMEIDLMNRDDPGRFTPAGLLRLLVRHNVYKHEVTIR